MVTNVKSLSFIGIFAFTLFAFAPFAHAQSCTMDAAQCPDGSWVGRSGPNCQFVCPGTLVPPPIPPIPVSCPFLSLNLYVGLRDSYTGGQVSQLQQFLSTRGYYQPVTGYFGSITAVNVARFQSEQGVYPTTGGVGPLTRLAIQRVCDYGGGSGGYGGNLTIGGISGPTQLAVGQSGTWNVRVSDNTGYLSYSVRWGDEWAMPYATAPSSYPIQSSATLTHSYAAAGNYSPVFTVTNAAGQSANASASVYVTGIPVTASGVSGRVTLGPTCPVQMYPPDPSCADRGYQTTVSAYQNGMFVGGTSSDINGQFSISLNPGTYELRARDLQAGSYYYPYCRPTKVTVPAGGYASATIVCDSGIR